MRLLFINDTDRVEIARALRESMRRRRDTIELVATDVSPNSPMRLVCDHFCVIPDTKHKKLEHAIVEIIRAYGVRAVLAGSNFDLPVLSRLSKRIQDDAVRLLCPSDNAIRVTLNKQSYPRFCQKANLLTPRIFDLNAGEVPRLPCVIKPSRGQGSKSTYLVTSLEEMQNALRMVSQPVVQEFVPGKLYTVDVFGDETGMPICSVPRLRERSIRSNSSVSRIELDEEIIDISTRLGRRLQIRGLYNFQAIKAAKGEVYVLDINPRLAPGAVLSMKAGAPFGRWTCDLMASGIVKHRQYRIRDGLAMLRYETQVYK